MRTAVITGASSGLGKAIAEHLVVQGHNYVERWIVHNWSLHPNPIEYISNHIIEDVVDVRDWESVRDAISKLENKQIDVLINCAGINSNAFLEQVSERDFDNVMNTNVKGILNCSQQLLPWLGGGTILNIVSNAAHIPMTSSLAYNASKGAALMATKQLARELMPRHGITVFSISPNKLRGTAMSQQIEDNVCRVRGWSREEARAYQAKALITGEETDPNDLAEFVAFLLSTKERHKWFAGCDIPYGL